MTKPRLNSLQICELISNDVEMMEILQIVSRINLPDWCICAGFVKNKVWDYVHGNTVKTQPTDIDVMFFEKSSVVSAREALLFLQQSMPSIDWDVANQAFTHTDNNDEAYTDVTDALSKLPETATSVGVKIKEGKVCLLAPLGTDDLSDCIIRPTPIFYERPERKQIVIERLYNKQLFEKWPLLKVII